MAAHPETKPRSTRDALPPPGEIPHRQELTNLWHELNSQGIRRKGQTIRRQLAPYIGGVFMLRWGGNDGPKHSFGYRFRGVVNEGGEWFYDLENTSISESGRSPEVLEKMQRDHGVVYPRFPLNRLLTHTNGGPTQAWVELPEGAVDSRVA